MERLKGRVGTKDAEVTPIQRLRALILSATWPVYRTYSEAIAKHECNQVMLDTVAAFQKRCEELAEERDINHIKAEMWKGKYEALKSQTARGDE